LKNLTKEALEHDEARKTGEPLAFSIPGCHIEKGADFVTIRRS
jgi:hypothetical protein